MPNWSEINLDVLQLILERLSIRNRLNARSVCKNWYRVSKESLIKVPWMIIFPSRKTKERSCQLFDPQEGRFYELNKLVNDFYSSQCIATSGSWLLMFDFGSRFYVLNIFTRERINLPPLKSHQGRIFVKKTRDKLGRDNFMLRIRQSSITARNALNQTKAVLWVDELTKNYVVVWSIGLLYMMFTKSGFDNWREIPTREGPEILHGCQDLVYKYNKLYVLSKQNRIRILDFSQELPRANSDNVYHNPFKNDGKGRAMIIGVTVSGDVLIVKNQLKKIFNIFKMGLEGTRWDRVKSLGDESWIADLGVTVRASVNGSKPNSVYYCRDMNVYCGDISTRSQVIQKYFTSLKLGCVRLFIPTL
ncbi:unnamed protein product [Arabidopsis lyrata]|uniref:F-box domain-containing protein n=1 Tax=Arabidopsis lyrata subsp. lyrata TaxID=81972 RepID=D7LFQ6_ARALL|nr:putative F-box protein At4g22660 [Arabidopsis lyrata subsp. lyrata]EFH55693.1 hypothetical protein ARALYDRAFT_902383 [Arabidopsis lyrata subsp. lyrata]CAH8264570.1 unnamed protein product [Arabidopsis lyrata]|eukprot:XP_002879434.1 putative F-box protein At4g22660 [Arabidopsis lyrata subsp. lyrata]